MHYIQVLEKCLKKTAQIEMLPLQAGDVPDTEANVSALVQATGYLPKVDVSEGVGKFVDWYRGYYK